MEIIIGVNVALFIGLGSLLMWFIKSKITKIDNIEENYLDRFDKVDNRFDELKDTNNDNHIELINAINTVELKVVTIVGKVDAQKEICEVIHGKGNG